MCCKVIKPIYGMAQAGRRWQRTLFPWLEEFGFKKCQHDSCIFKCEKEVNTPDGPRKEVLTLGVYVDDLVTLYFHDDEHSLYQQFATELQKWGRRGRGRAHRSIGRRLLVRRGGSFPHSDSVHQSLGGNLHARRRGVYRPIQPAASRSRPASTRRGRAG